MIAPRPVDEDAITDAARLLSEGRLAILPTDTVYGIAADVRQDRAVAAIPAAKGRAAGMPLQLLFDSEMRRIEKYAVLSEPVSRLIEALGVGAWTIIAVAAARWTSPALAGGRTVGFRIPASPVVHHIVGLLDAPLAASSANRHGHPSPTSCADAIAEVGESCAIALDDGPTMAGVDSTVIDCSGAATVILREGAIDRQTVARILGITDIPVIRSVRQ